MRRGLAIAALLSLVAAPAGAQDMPAEAAAAAVPADAPPAVEVTTRTEADGTVTLVHSALIEAPPPEVWTAVSTPEGWVTWAVPLARWAEGESDVLETSYNPDELAGGPGAIWQQFVARIPGRLLVFRTIKTPDDFPHGEAYKKVTGIFELAAEGEATRVRLTSTGFPDSEGGRMLAGFFAKGNAATLESLQRRFVEGAKVWAAQPTE